MVSWRSAGIGKVLFWNVAGLFNFNKDRNFWEYVESADFVSLAETWLEEKDIKNMETKLSNEFTWRFIAAKRKHIKGREMGGFLIGGRKSLLNQNDKIGIEISEGLVKSEIKGKKGKTSIWSVYNSGKINKFWEKLEEYDLLDEDNLIIGGDFNIRIGVEGNSLGHAGHGDFKVRESKDKVINNGGK